MGRGDKGSPNWTKRGVIVALMALAATALCGVVAIVPPWVKLLEERPDIFGWLARALESVRPWWRPAVAGTLLLVGGYFIVWSRARLARRLQWLAIRARRRLKQIEEAAVRRYVAALRWLVDKTAGGQLQVLASTPAGASPDTVGRELGTGIGNLSDVACEVLHKGLMDYDRFGIPGIWIKPEEVPSLATTVGSLRQLGVLERAVDELYAARLLARYENGDDSLAMWVLLPQVLWDKRVCTEVAILLQDELQRRGAWGW